MNQNNVKIDNGDISSFISNGQRLPDPPKKGELMYCQVCGEPMLPEQFSKIPFQRKREFKWHIHGKCFSFLDELADRSVPGLLAERKRAQGK